VFVFEISIWLFTVIAYKLMKNAANKSTKKKPIYFEIDEFDN